MLHTAYLEGREPSWLELEGKRLVAEADECWVKWEAMGIRECCGYERATTVSWTGKEKCLVSHTNSDPIMLTNSSSQSSTSEDNLGPCRHFLRLGTGQRNIFDYSYSYTSFLFFRFPIHATPPSHSFQSPPASPDQPTQASPSPSRTHPPALARGPQSSQGQVARRAIP